MLNYLIIALISLAGGAGQSITGFGAGIIIMTVLPSVISMGLAPAVSGTICTPLSISIAWRYRKYAKWKMVLFPCAVYMAASGIAIYLSSVINMDKMKPLLGVFLILMALYFIFLDKKVSVKGTLFTAFLCSAVSGVLGGFFGIGGPFLVLYYLAVTATKEEYLGSINLLFAITTVYQLVMRIATGVLTVPCIPWIAVGIAFVLLGRIIGSRIVDRMNVEKMRKAIYIFLIFAGIMTIVK